MTEEKPRKNPSEVDRIGTGIRTRDLRNASLLRYHGATLLGDGVFCKAIVYWKHQSLVLRSYYGSFKTLFLKLLNTFPWQIDPYLAQ